MNKKIGSVALVGGTHGNELTGIYTVKHWQNNQLHKNYPSFQLEYLYANTEAMAQNKRYLQHDLNRCFKSTDLADQDKTSLEQQRAKQINQHLGPKGQARVDFIIDLHTSTANMQTNIVLIQSDPFHLQLAAYLTSVLDGVVVTSESELMADNHFLCSIADKNLLIEIGPIPQGVLEPEAYFKTHAAVKATLDFVELYNHNALPDLGETLRVLTYFSKLYLPKDAFGEISAMVHPGLICRDYTRISQGTPIFIDFFGNDILYQGEDALVTFVNEAAYYDKKLALCLCHENYYNLTSFQKIDSHT